MKLGLHMPAMNWEGARAPFQVMAWEGIPAVADL